MNKRTFTVIFCDDVRHEINSKPSLMGCYFGSIFFDRLPSAMPALYIFIEASTPNDNLFKSLEFQVFVGEKIVTTSPLPTEVLAALQEPYRDKRGVTGKRHIYNTMAIVPFAVEAPTKITVKAITESEEMIIGSLHVLSDEN